MPKLCIDLFSAPLPLTVQNVEVQCSYLRADVGIVPYNDKRNVSSACVGADAHIGPHERTVHSYILYDQRQRRRSRDDTTFNAPCMEPPYVWYTL